MAHYAQKDPDLQATEKIYQKIMSTGRDTGRFTSPSPHSSVGRGKSGHPTPRRAAQKGSKSGHSTSRGVTVLAEKQMNRHFPDPSEALKRTYDGATPRRNLSPASTVRTGQSISSKKRAVTNTHTPVKTPTGHIKGDKHLTGVPFEKKILDVENAERWNRSYQALRLEKEWTELDECRNMKRNSEIVRHRVDKMYMMSGSGIRLKPKYDINEDELQQLKELSQARQVLRDKAKKNQKQHMTEELSYPHFTSPQVSSLPPHPTPVPGRHSYAPDTPDSGYKVSPRSDDGGTVKQIPEVAMLSRTESKSPIYRSDSPESGIQADVQREDELQDDRLEELEEAEFGELEFHEEDLENVGREFEGYDDDRPISRVEIRTQSGMCLDGKDVRVMDIFKHQLSTNKDLCMLEMSRQQSPKVPEHYQMEDDTPPARQSSSHKITIHPGRGSYTILPFDPYDNLKTRRTKQEKKPNYRCGRGPPLPKKKKNNPNVPQIQQFPVRKPSSRFIVAQGPIGCKCRESSYDTFPVLSVNGYQMHLANRVM